MNHPMRPVSPRAARSLITVFAGAAALVTARLAQAEPQGFLETIKHHTTLINTVPDNGDQNPYAVVVAPVTAGTVKVGDVLVGNFSNSTNLQGTGNTIINYHPDTKQMSVFATVPRDLKGVPGRHRPVHCDDDAQVGLRDRRQHAEQRRHHRHERCRWSYRDRPERQDRVHH